MRVEKLKGEFGKLMVLERVSTSSDGRRVWRCQCECGRMRLVIKDCYVARTT